MQLSGLNLKYPKYDLMCQMQSKLLYFCYEVIGKVVQHVFEKLYK